VRAVLTFHGVDTSGSLLSFPPEGLRRLVRGIRASGHEIVPLSRLLAEPPVDDQVSLSFDDGFASVHESALPVLRDEGADATLFLTTGYVGRSNDWPMQPSWVPRFRMLDWGQVEALHGAGWAIEAHTVSHPDLRGLSDDALEAELAEADQAIARRLGRPPVGFSFPYGACDERVRECARKRYQFCVTTQLASLDGLDAANLSALGVPRLDSYYLRHPLWHRRFGGAPFRAYLGVRAWLRELRSS